MFFVEFQRVLNEFYVGFDTELANSFNPLCQNGRTAWAGLCGFMVLSGFYSGKEEILIRISCTKSHELSQHTAAVGRLFFVRLFERDYH